MVIQVETVTKKVHISKKIPLYHLVKLYKFFLISILDFELSLGNMLNFYCSITIGLLFQSLNLSLDMLIGVMLIKNVCYFWVIDLTHNKLISSSWINSSLGYCVEKPTRRYDFSFNGTGSLVLFKEKFHLCIGTFLDYNRYIVHRQWKSLRGEI